MFGEKPGSIIYVAWKVVLETTYEQSTPSERLALNAAINRTLLPRPCSKGTCLVRSLEDSALHSNPLRPLTSEDGLRVRGEGTVPYPLLCVLLECGTEVEVSCRPHLARTVRRCGC